MNQLYKKALAKADEVRRKEKLTMYEPINIFDLCTRLGLSVRFIDVSMEGLYRILENGRNPTILLSNQRPLPRRCFTCAHELGHHEFNHGNRWDAITDEIIESASKHPDETLVDYFAGALLMPVAGIMAEFAKRDWDLQKASPVQYYTICSFFGTGYKTLVVHCKANRLITEAKATTLLRFTPAKIFKTLFDPAAELSYFKIIDSDSKLQVIDIEVSNYVLLPPGICIEGEHLQRYQQTSAGVAYKAVRPGIVRVATADGALTSFVRIQNERYVGLVENRHLEI